MSINKEQQLFKNIIEVDITCAEDLSFELLFDINHSIEEKILKEQFLE